MRDRESFDGFSIVFLLVVLFILFYLTGGVE